MKKYIITICIIIGLIVIGIIGFFVYENVNRKPDDELFKSKINQEMLYLDKNIISIMNRFNHISYPNYKVVESEATDISKQDNNSSQGDQKKQSGTQSEDNSQQGEEGGSQGSKESIEISNVVPNSILSNENLKIDWNEIKEEIELIYSIWPSILVDLSSLNINRDDLLKFTDTLNKIVNSLEDENKADSLIQLADLYSLIDLYLRGYSDNSNIINAIAVKSSIVRAYALIERDNNWGEVKSAVNNAKIQYANILNDSLNINNVSNINRGYIILNEMEKNIDKQDKKIFYINYKNLMQELDIILEE